MRILLRAFALAAMLCAPSAHAAETTEYTITIQEVLLKKTTGEWVSVIRPDKQIDLVNVEPSLSFFNNEGRVPEGRYTNFKVLLSETFRVAGQDKSNRTKAGGSATLKGTPERSTDLATGEITAFDEKTPTLTTEGDPGPVHLHYDFGSGDTDEIMTITAKRDFPQPLDVKKGSFIKIWFDVSVEGAVRYAWPGSFGPGVPAGDVMTALPPERIEELVISVDERDEKLSPEAIVLEF